ncbi:MAG: polysaccharide biosynthesis protein [Actinobacteria bacterium]|nr:polysaccharide biosynthesis protein [Actinomycetota bacterium]
MTAALKLTRRRLLAMVIDAIIIVIAYYATLAFRFAGRIPEDISFTSRSFAIFAALAIFAHLAANWVGSVYAIVNRYVGLPQALRLGEGSLVVVAVLTLIALGWPTGRHLLPLSVVIVGGVGATVAMIGVRFYGRVFHERSLSNVGGGKRLLLVGSGQAADMIVREIHRNPALRVHVVGLVDDDPSLWGMRLHNHPVLGAVEDVPRLVATHEVNEVLVCIPSATPEQMTRIYRQAKLARVPIKTLPNLTELVDGTASLADARALDIEDLLGRPKAQTDLADITAYLRGRRVLVTGAGGSIGSELVRQIAGFLPAELVLVDRDESALYDLHEQLRVSGFHAYALVPASILGQAKMEQVFAEHRPEVVFHAAAFKHVPLMELHPDQAVLNNVKGTLMVAEAAAQAGAERFVNISTDKAVDPVNVMGATKRVGEHVLHHLAPRYPKTRFVSVRFGNVLGSRGSVIPIFRRQIEAGGPVTITHPEMTRYFMMIEEAVQLVLQAAALDDLPNDVGAQGAQGHHGTLILEMGEPVPIMDLARKMIDLMANGRADAIDIDITGLRPGEKLHENLVCRGERTSPTKHPLIRLARFCRDDACPESPALPPGFARDLERLIALAERHASPEELVAALQACVPTYEPFDWDGVGTFPGARPAREEGAEGAAHRPSAGPMVPFPLEDMARQGFTRADGV